MPTTEPTLPAGVALTAVIMAREREVETGRPDALLDDPWAHDLVERAAPSFPPEADAEGWVAQRLTLGEISPVMEGYVPVRTRWLDDAVLAAVRGGVTQVVLLGAGLDTRALRLPWPGPVTVYAVDQPGVVAFVGHVLAGAAPRVPGTRVVPVGVDLAGPWADAVVAAGLDPSAPTVWLAEGLLPYLSPAEGGALLDLVRSLSGPGSTLLADVMLPAARVHAGYAAGRRALEDNNSPLHGVVEDPVAWLGEHGWAGERVDAVAMASRLGRPAPPSIVPDGALYAFLRGQNR